MNTPTQVSPTPIQRAVEILGGPSKVAALLKVTPQAVCFWRDGDRRFPAEYCPAIEKETAGSVTCEDLRPDVDWGYVRATGCEYPKVGAGETAEPLKEAA